MRSTKLGSVMNATMCISSGPVELEVVTDLVTTAKDGSDDILNSLGALLLADLRPSPLPIPDKFYN